MQNQRLINKCENKFLVIFGLLVTKILMDISYIFIMHFEFSSFLYRYDPDITKIFESYVIYLFIAYFSILKLMSFSKTSDYILVIFFFFLLVPILSMYGFYTFPRLMIYTIIGGFMFSYFFTSTLPDFKLPIVKNSLIFKVLILITSMFVYMDLIVNGGLERFNLGLFDVYETRGGYGENRSFITERLIFTQAYVVNMFLFSLALYRRKIGFILFMIILQVLIFGMTGFKSFLFGLLFVYFTFLISTNKLKAKAFKLLNTLIILILFLSIAHYFILNNTDVVTLSLRRALFTPALNHFLYFDYFSQHVNNYLSNTIFNPFIDSIYSLPTTRVISINYFGKAFGANVGFYGDAFMQFGILGVFLFSSILIFLFKFLDSLTNTIPSSIVISTIAMPVYSLINSSLVDVLIVHGLGFALILLWLSSFYFKNEFKGGLNNE